MKNMIKIIILTVALTFSVKAETNKACCVSTNATQTGKGSGGWELTLGGGGVSINGNESVGLDVSLSTNPLEIRPEIWLGIVQGAYWEPTFAGSTDMFIDWSQHIWNDSLYANIGWSGGLLYDTKSSVVWRTGPELTLQYYLTDSTFVYGGVNYDLYSTSKADEGGFRYSWGLGFSF